MAAAGVVPRAAPIRDRRSAGPSCLDREAGLAAAPALRDLVGVRAERIEPHQLGSIGAAAAGPRDPRRVRPYQLRHVDEAHAIEVVRERGRLGSRGIAPGLSSEVPKTGSTAESALAAWLPRWRRGQGRPPRAGSHRAASPGGRRSAAFHDRRHFPSGPQRADIGLRDPSFERAGAGDHDEARRRGRGRRAPTNSASATRTTYCASASADNPSAIIVGGAARRDPDS